MLTKEMIEMLESLQNDDRASGFEKNTAAFILKNKDKINSFDAFLEFIKEDAGLSYKGLLVSKAYHRVFIIRTQDEPLEGLTPESIYNQALGDRTVTIYTYKLSELIDGGIETHELNGVNPL